jgi:hypothetical protein
MAPAYSAGKITLAAVTASLLGIVEAGVVASLASV